MTQEEQIFELKKENEKLQNDIKELSDKYIADFHTKTELINILSKIETDLRTIASRL